MRLVKDLKFKPNILHNYKDILKEELFWREFNYFNQLTIGFEDNSSHL